MKNFKYKVNDTALCFEPDISKAKLIYFCRIIEYCSVDVNDKGKSPEYYVHFFGWKRKYDRRVSEDLILENNHFNRMLKRKIDEVAYNVKDIDERKSRIDTILIHASTCSDDVDWNTFPGVWKPENKNNSSQLNTSMESDSSPELISRINFCITEKVHEKFENDETHLTFMPKLKIDRSLVEIMENHIQNSRIVNDFFTTNFFLQSYLDGFPYEQIKLPGWNQFENHKKKIRIHNMMIIERNAKILQQTYEERDSSRILCAEIIHGLRVLFDELFFDYILTRDELNFENPVTTPPYQMEDAAKAYNFYLLKSSIKIYHDDEDLTSLPCGNYGPRYFLRLLVRLPEILTKTNLTICRKALVTRHVQMLLNYMSETREFWFRSPKNLFESIIDFPSDSIIYKIAMHNHEKNNKIINILKSETRGMDTASLNTLPQMTIGSCGTTESIISEDSIDDTTSNATLSSSKPNQRRSRKSFKEVEKLVSNLKNITPKSRHRIRRSVRKEPVKYIFH